MSNPVSGMGVDGSPCRLRKQRTPYNAGVTVCSARRPRFRGARAHAFVTEHFLFFTSA